MGPLVLPVAPACSRALAMGTALCGELLRSTRALLRVGSAGDRIDTGPRAPRSLGRERGHRAMCRA